MLKITHADTSRILDNLNRSLDHHLDHNEYRLAFKVLAIALRDAWISSHEYKWEMKRRKFNKTVDRFNFESVIKTHTINKL